jgi:hypothetical protein
MGRQVRVCAIGVAGVLALNAQDWKLKLGSDPVYQETIGRYLKTTLSLPDPAKAPARDNWQPVSDTSSALVNVYRLSGESAYRDQARRIADWLMASNDYLTAHRDRQIPYLGWGPETRTGYFQCKDVKGYHADDLWDTASAMRCLLKVAEVDSAPAQSKYLERAKKIADAWPYVDHAPAGDGPYAAAGMRWYRKSNEACENRYVKNTNIEMGEQLFRIYNLTGAASDLARAVKVLNTQLWDVLTHRNLAYSSYMTYVDRTADYAEQAAHNEKKVVHKDGAIRCGEKDASCWNHLGYEGYATFNIQQIARGLTAGTMDDIAKALRVTMEAWHSSPFGDTERFDWSGTESATHVVAYNCALRFSADPTFDRLCREGLRHSKSSTTVFYSLVPESLFAAGTR